MREIKLIIDQKEIRAKRGEKILWTALDNDIYIPNLCAIREADIPFSGCRLCLIEIELTNKRKIVASCSEPAKDGLVIYTNSERIKRLRKSAFELIMSDHFINCPECEGRKKCILLKIAGALSVKIRPKRFRKLEKNLPPDTSCQNILFDPNKCVKCAKCIFVCEKSKDKILNFINKGIDIMVSTFDNIPLKNFNSQILVECAKICPTGALVYRDL